MVNWLTWQRTSPFKHYTSGDFHECTIAFSLLSSHAYKRTIESLKMPKENVTWQRSDANLPLLPLLTQLTDKYLSRATQNHFKRETALLTHLFTIFYHITCPSFLLQKMLRKEANLCGGRGWKMWLRKGSTDRYLGTKNMFSLLLLRRKFRGKGEKKIRLHKVEFMTREDELFFSVSVGIFGWSAPSRCHIRAREKNDLKDERPSQRHLYDHNIFRIPHTALKNLL